MANVSSKIDAQYMPRIMHMAHILLWFGVDSFYPYSSKLHQLHDCPNASEINYKAILKNKANNPHELPGPHNITSIQLYQWDML